MSRNLPLDSTRIRALFPAFAEPSLKGQRFFENAGGSYTSGPVLERLSEYYRRTKVQPYGPYSASREAGRAMDQAYMSMAQVLNVDPDWVHFGPSTSANTYALAHAFSKILSPGDAIIVTDQDHEANSGVWRRLADQGVTVREWQVDVPSGHLDPQQLANLLDDKVKLVAFPHVSNIVGEVNPVAQICRMVHEAGAVAIVDGVSYAPHSLPDVHATGADIYLLSAYKTFGPHQGVMTIRPDLAHRLPNQGHYFNEKKLRLRFNPAGPDHAQIAAVAGIADYLAELAAIAGSKEKAPAAFERARAAMQEQESALMEPLCAYLSATNRFRLIGPTDPAKRVPTFSLQLDRPGREAAQTLSQDGIMAGGGHFYAVRLLERLGIDPEHGVLRLSFVHYTDLSDIDALIAALDRL